MMDTSVDVTHSLFLGMNIYIHSYAHIYIYIYIYAGPFRVHQRAKDSTCLTGPLSYDSLLCLVSSPNVFRYRPVYNTGQECHSRFKVGWIHIARVPNLVMWLLANRHSPLDEKPR